MTSRSGARALEFMTRRSRGRRSGSARRHPGARRRRQDGPDARAHGQARRARQARHRRRPVFRARPEGASSKRMASRRIACDLLDRAALERLPRETNVIFMAGRKFGADGQRVAHLGDERRCARHGGRNVSRDSRIVAFSTACVYPFIDVGTARRDGATPPLPPPGEYANSCVGRERMFEHFSRRYGTPGRLCGLDYAIDMRYGVLHDVAHKVFAGQPVDARHGPCQRHLAGRRQRAGPAPASRTALRRPRPINVSGPKVIACAGLPANSASASARRPRFPEKRPGRRWLVDTAAATELLGAPRVPIEQMIDWVADWVARGGPSLGKPTHFETRDGKY